ncbi:DNA polymerase III subunit delta' [Haloimpatiens sp. FM7315]|uniref:DNA polymerase III subunit delta' n=1 Tax=Haloimpatiens sp. FM7315 TaxID=3298609 RepID=UPI00370AF292
MSFESIIGHEDVKKQLVMAIDSRGLSHAHLIAGEDGIGKSCIAKAMALRILGKTKEIDYVDIVEWKIQKGEKSLKVNAIRLLIEEINKKPYEMDKKVIIVYEADKMTEEAQNALLKTIEEPPKGVFLILLCENLEIILNTIRSRCQIHKLRPLRKEELYDFIKKRYGELEKEEVDAAMAFSEGIPGKAEIFIKDESFHDMRNNVLKMLIMITKSSENEVLEYEKFLNLYKDSWTLIVNCMLTFIRDAMVYKETSDRDLIINKDKIKQIQELANIFSYKKLNDIINIIEDAMRSLRKNVNTSLVFQMMLLKLQEV